MPIPAIAALVREYQSRRPLRAWSLIITLYGDAIVPRGGSLWLGALIEIMDLFGIDGGHVRTSKTVIVRVRGSSSAARTTLPAGLRAD